MDEETEVSTIYQRVTQIEMRHVTAPQGLTFNQLTNWTTIWSAPITRTALMSRESGRIDYRDLPL